MFASEKAKQNKNRRKEEGNGRVPQWLEVAITSLWVGQRAEVEVAAAEREPSYKKFMVHSFSNGSSDARWLVLITFVNFNFNIYIPFFSVFLITIKLVKQNPSNYAIFWFSLCLSDVTFVWISFNNSLLINAPRSLIMQSFGFFLSLSNITFAQIYYNNSN